MDPIISIGRQAPQFQLRDIKGDSYSLKDQQGNIVALNFWSAECNWCERIDQELLAYMESWKEKVQIWWIASNANETSEWIHQVAIERNLSTVLMDADQHVANLYNAQTTPHFFIVDQQGRLAYQGAWDDVTFRQRTATQVYVPKVIESLHNNQTPEITQTPPYGCALVRQYKENG